MLLIDVSKPCYTRKINLEFSLKILGTFNAYLHAYIVIADYKQASQYSYWRCIKLYFFSIWDSSTNLSLLYTQFVSQRRVLDLNLSHRKPLIQCSSSS